MDKKIGRKRKKTILPISNYQSAIMSTELIKAQLKSIPKTSGVYLFSNAEGQVIYVGKAKNLYKRVTSYTKVAQLSARIFRMVSLAQKLEFVQTENEVEALLLECNLIKKFAPKFNILLRDGKTFPQILISDHNFPRIAKYRGSRNDKGLHFGPFASGNDVYKTIEVLRKTFMLRNCTDAEFKSRKKPCLEYQIKKCTGPCCGLISQEEYKSSVNQAVAFLSGKSVQVQKELTQKMQNLSEAQEYEKAAVARDQIKALNSIQIKQNIHIDEFRDTDIITLVKNSSTACIYVAFFRFGQSHGAKPYFFNTDDRSSEQILSEFLGQFYLSQTPPTLVLLNLKLPEEKLLSEFLSKIGEKKVIINVPKRGAKIVLIKAQEKMAQQNLDQKNLQNLSNRELHFELKKIFNLPKIPQKIEVYDNSHTGGENAVGVLISAGIEGFIKSGYRKFNLFKPVHDAPSEYTELKYHRDDTAMMREVLFRRFSKLKKSDYPDLIILDGGKGQLNAAQEIFDQLKIKIPTIAMSKGENRNAGEEKFYQIDENGEIKRSGETMEKHHPVMHYLQRLRDEAHRFAIMTHRKKRAKKMIEE